MDTGAVRIVVDTNVVVSMIGRTSPNRWIFDKILSGAFLLCISNEILLEYEEILSKQTRPEIASNFVSFLSVFPNVVHTEVFYNWNLIQADPDDNKFVDCAIASKSFCIVSEDKHFKPYKNNEHPPLRVLTILEFKALFYE
jgi:putative PIN family toxin of toxin-antitoxin system